MFYALCNASGTQDATKRQSDNAVANQRGLPRGKSWIASNFVAYRYVYMFI